MQVFVFFFFGCSLVKKQPKKAGIQKKKFWCIILLGSIYIPNFRKFNQTVWILPIFSFLSILAFFCKKKAKKGKNRKLGSVVNFHLLKGIYVPNFRKFHRMVCILAIFFYFFWPFFALFRPKKAKIENRALW